MLKRGCALGSIRKKRERKRKRKKSKEM